MALKPREDEMPLGLSIDTKSSEELQPPNTNRLVQNLHWRGLGELEKRPAYNTNHTVAAPSGSAYAVSDSCGLIVREDDAVLVTGEHGVMTYSEVTSSAQWARRTTTGTPVATMKFCPVSYDVSRRFVDAAQYNTRNLGVHRIASAQYNGIQVIAWTGFSVADSTYYLRLKAFEADTGKLVATNEITGAGASSALQACEYTESGKEGVLIVYITEAIAPGTARTVRYDAATNEFVGDSNLSTNVKTSAIFTVKSGNRIYFGFTDNTSGFLVVQDRTIGAITTTHTATHGGDAGAYAVKGTNRTLIVSCTTTDAYAEVFGQPASAITVLTASSETFSGVTAARETRVGSTDDAVMWVNSAVSSTPTGMRVRCAEVDFNANTPVEGHNLVIPHCWTISHGFQLQGAAHATFAAFIHSTAYGIDQPARPGSCFVARWRGNDNGLTDRMDAVAKVCHDRFFTLAFEVQASSHVDAYNNAWVAFSADPSEWSTGLSSSSLPQTVFLERLTAKRPMPMPHAPVQRGVTLVAGGLPWVYDGDTPSEAAALCTPRVKLDVSAGGSFSGTFGLRAMYRRVDRAGNLYLMPGPVVSTGVIASKAIDAYVSICPFTAFDGEGGGGTEDELEPELYITVDGGSTYYLATDSTLTGNKLTYTSKTSNGLWFKFEIERTGRTTDPEFPFPATGSDGLPGPTAPEPVPAFRHVAKVVDRIIAIDAELPSRVWFSKPLVSGYGPEWSISNTLTVEDDCTATVDMGGGFMVLARGGAYYVSGEGPNERGVGAFTPAVKVNHQVDCIDPVSVCRTPLGAIFRGRRGFYVLQGAEAQPWAVPLDPEVLTDPALDPSSAASYRMRVVFQEQTNEIQIIGAPSSDSGANTCPLVYNLLEQKWSRYQQTELVHDICVARGKVWRLDKVSGGADLLRDEMLFSQEGADYNEFASNGWEIDTGWRHPDDVGGLIRLWRAWLTAKLPADNIGVDELTVDYYADFVDTALQTFVWTGAELAALYDSSNGDPVVSLPMHFRKQVVRAFRLKIACSFVGATSGPKPLKVRLRWASKESKGKRLRAEVKG